jgi:hypothetical protein
MATICIRRRVCAQGRDHHPRDDRPVEVAFVQLPAGRADRSQPRSISRQLDRCSRVRVQISVRRHHCGVSVPDENAVGVDAA